MGSSSGKAYACQAVLGSSEDMRVDRGAARKRGRGKEICAAHTVFCENRLRLCGREA